MNLTKCIKNDTNLRLMCNFIVIQRKIIGIKYFGDAMNYVDLSKLLYHKLFEILRKLLPRRVKLLIADFYFKIYKRKMQLPLLRFEVHLTDKCNLNCAGCLHFSPLCDETNLLDMNIFENDCRRISQLTNGKIADIRLFGGEPLLHPGIKDFLILTRKYFPEISISNQTGIIVLVTNGILLHEQSDDFWITCKNNNIRIFISDYPVKIKEEIVKEKAMKFSVELKLSREEMLSKAGGSANQWIKIPIDTDGLHDNRKSFGKCFLAGYCFQLVNGKIFKCPRIAYTKYFNAAFDKQLKTDEDDYVDIYKAENINEILYLLTKPASFCRYCNADDITWNNKWKVSEKKIDEYI
jgi:organic radical activating enzyme